jgi:decaprenyl-phosphate phosphoribosyltransferase
MKDYILLLRPNQYVKNLFIYMPLFFALQITNLGLFSRATIAFVAFCFCASSVYVFNDYYDIKEDQLHPKKRQRPLAAGRVSRKKAFTLIGLLLFCGLSISFALDSGVLCLVLFYIILNIAYTVKLKHIAVLDIFVIATGFVIRIFIGGTATQVRIYPWIVIMTFLLALFLALAKRRDDVLIFLQTEKQVRKSIEGYNLAFINAAMIATAAITMVAYIMYTISPEIQTKFATDKLYLTSIFVVLGIMKYMHLTFVESNTGSPSAILLHDRFIQLTILVWLLAFFALIY